MQIIQLKRDERLYSCHSYLILGDWNRLKDLNTVIDPGTNEYILEEIERRSTGLGKVAVEQVILTHSHFDHNGGVQALKRRYGARVLAFAAGPGVDRVLRDGETVRAGDDLLEVIHTPGHSSDSICLFAPRARALFSGDTQFRPCDSYPPGHLEALERLTEREVERIYSGHDDPVLTGAAQILQGALNQAAATMNRKTAAPL